MGERGNIGFVSVGNLDADKIEIVWLYTHWQGYAIESLAANAIVAAQPRWGDSSYATRIALTTLVGGVQGTTGWGVGTRPGEASYDVPVIDWDRQTVTMLPAEIVDNAWSDYHAVLKHYASAERMTFPEFLAHVADVESPR